MSETYAGHATAHFGAEGGENLKGDLTKPVRRYPRWVVPSFMVFAIIAIVAVFGLIFAPLTGSVPLEMALALVLAGCLFGMSVAVRRVAIIRGPR